MVAGKSPGTLPSGWSEHIKVKKGRKIKHYVDPVSGYSFLSKMDAMRYVETGDIGKCVKKPKKDDSLLGAYNKPNRIQESSGNEVSENEKPTNIESEASIQPTSGNEVSNAVSSIAVKDNAVDGLPPGWVKEIKSRVHAYGIRRDPLYIDPVSGYVFFSKKDVMRYVETGDIGKCLIRPKRRDSLLESNSKYHYADPVSRYSSFPKMDAMPYVETGDIGKCVEKPKKDDSLLGAYNKSNRIQASGNEVSENEKSTNIESEASIQPTSGNEMSKNEKPTNIESEASIQPTSGNEVSNTVSVVAVKDNAVDGLPPGWVKEIKTRVHAHGIRRDPLYIDPVSGYVFFSKKDVMRYVETGDIGKCLMRPKKRDSLSETYSTYQQSVYAILDAIFTMGHPETVSMCFSTEDSPSATMGKITRQSICSNEETRVTDSGNSSTSSRFSKRLAGHNPEEVADLGLVSEQTLRVAIRNHAGTDATNISSAQTLNVPPPHVHDISNSVGSERDAPLAPACQDLQPATNSGVTEPDETVEGDKHSPVAENQAVSEDPKPILGDDSEPKYPFGDCLSDPCFEFAFKTLTGAISVEDFIPCEQASHKESCPPLSEACFDLPIFDSFPNDMSSRSAPPDKHTPKNLMTATSPTTTNAKP